MSILTHVIDFIAIRLRALRQDLENRRRRLRRWFWQRRQVWMTHG